MGGKKKWGESGGGEKAPTFSKTKKGAISKKKGRKMGGYKNPPIFKKWGRCKLRKIGERLVGANKYRIFVFKKKKEKMGTR